MLLRGHKWSLWLPLCSFFSCPRSSSSCPRSSSSFRPSFPSSFAFFLLSSCFSSFRSSSYYSSFRSSSFLFHSSDHFSCFFSFAFVLCHLFCLSDHSCCFSSSSEFFCSFSCPLPPSSVPCQDLPLLPLLPGQTQNSQLGSPPQESLRRERGGRGQWPRPAAACSSEIGVSATMRPLVISPC